MPLRTVRGATALIFAACAAQAQDRLTQDGASFAFNGAQVTISRDVAEAGQHAQTFVTPDADCGDACIAPMQVAQGVETLGEAEVLDFLVTQVATGRGLMVDARVPAERAKGYIPGTVSLPHTTLLPENAYRKEILLALGGRSYEDVFNFSDARLLLIYDNGPVSNDAGLLVAHLLQVGYPAELIRYYRGGMQVWSSLGFNMETGQS
ncbi:rhodanese-like domain-containing protein [Sulfitobacter sp. M57]|uniref:rhodanese-like domain-containing protein n=1 Tax=unclassified Sulfitobacter TaxID=196795 RepID=UPI0023E270B7|nr:MULTISPECIES: rhodanese-like domain-containing protein [unclassified Sulfitobacter]MDF3415395.1 rhodanese-like domain-containing protein [Sulfitobacter sp. KE5]MDF3422876.1 rhodanese-like domain-containing protein [Sulfitobacter sp. KE43]MDF3433941.1 rhodanese-like domain-containing protein [Sulfitobacter sp. KE42]MDF3459581.1 rhodanese-like domain-containing protein [Sulfitobacter sp. S74]MDF3463480.1 rhodanese-like domain-containing protein [Sulfitobacter sp. Ks18]